MDLTPEQRAEAERLYLSLRAAAAADLRALAELLAAKPDGELLGRTEFEVRDRALRVGAKAVEQALAGRKKGATTAPAGPAPAAARPRSSSAGRRSGS
jgi:hypothetical protein